MEKEQKEKIYNSRNLIFVLDIQTIPDNHFLEIAVYNLKGQKIDVLFNGYQDPGFYTHTWEATNYASGVYFIYFLSDEFSFSKKVVLIK